RQTRDGVGIAFSPPPPEVRLALDRFLASLLAQRDTQEAIADAVPDEFNPKAIEAAIHQEKATHLANRETAEQIHAAARKALESGRWTHAAIALLERAIELCPGIAAYHHDLGAALYRIGEIDRAVVALDHALSLEPEQG